MMTLEEAIDHCEEVAKKECGECAKEHLQLAKWLKELKERRSFDTDLISRQAAIDALRKLREEDIEDYGCEIPEGFNQDDLDRATFAIKQLPSAQPEPIKINIEDFNKEDWERFRKEWASTPITVLSAQPKKGRWISADAIFGGVPFYCSECGENTRDTVMGEPRWKFCPMCGSRNEVTT